MTSEEVYALPASALTLRCARDVMGWEKGEPAWAGFRPCEDIAQALLLVERLAAVDFVLHRFAGAAAARPFWMAWFGTGVQATADTPALAVCRAALLYATRRAGQAPTPHQALSASC
jgi:hypothetical protein